MHRVLAIPNVNEILVETRGVPWRGAKLAPGEIYGIPRIFLDGLSIPPTQFETYSVRSVAGVVATGFLEKRSAGFRRAVLGYALWLAAQRRDCADLPALTGAAVCRTVDALREELGIPLRVAAHLRGILGAAGFGELRSDAAPIVRRMLEETKEA